MRACMPCVVCLVPAGHGSCFFSGSPPPSKVGATSVSSSPNPNRDGRPDGPAFETPLGRPTALAANGSDPQPARHPPHDAAGHSDRPGRGVDSTANSTASDNRPDQHSVWAQDSRGAHNRTLSAAAPAVSRVGGASPAGGITAASVGVSADGPTCQCDRGWLGQFCQQSEFFSDCDRVLACVRVKSSRCFVATLSTLCST